MKYHTFMLLSSMIIAQIALTSPRKPRIVFTKKRKSKEIALIKAIGGIGCTSISLISSIISGIVTIDNWERIKEYANGHRSEKASQSSDTDQNFWQGLKTSVEKYKSNIFNIFPEIKPGTGYLVAPPILALSLIAAYIGYQITISGFDDLEEIAQKEDTPHKTHVYI